MFSKTKYGAFLVSKNVSYFHFFFKVNCKNIFSGFYEENNFIFTFFLTKFQNKKIVNNVTFL